MMMTNLSKLKALCVEDEPLIAMDAQMFLEDLGFGEVIVAMSASCAFQQLLDHKFDFALLDINLGHGQTTLPIAENLQRSGTRFAFATGYNRQEGMIDHLDAPSILKPYDAQAVASVVEQCFGQRLLKAS